jgi:hypothetical protein
VFRTCLPHSRLLILLDRLEELCGFHFASRRGGGSLGKNRGGRRSRPR